MREVRYTLTKSLPCRQYIRPYPIQSCTAMPARPVLLQYGTHGQIDNKTKLVFYYSQLTSPNIAKCHGFELECLAVGYAIERFLYTYQISHLR